MAILTQKTVVCDEGLDKCDNTQLFRVRLSIDGKTTAQVLCAKHVIPFQKMRQKMGGVDSPARGRIYTPEEIAAKKRTRKAGA